MPSDSKGDSIRTLIDVSLTSGAAAASEARRLVKEVDDRLPPERVEDILLLVSELVTNSVRHSGNESTSEVGFALRASRACLRIEVFDRGLGFDKVVTPSTAEQQSGWGLQIVEKLTDRWGVEPVAGAGSTVWFEIDL